MWLYVCFKYITLSVCVKSMDSNWILSFTKPIMTERNVRDTARYTAIVGDMTEPYCQVSGCTAWLLSHSSRQADVLKQGHAVYCFPQFPWLTQSLAVNCTALLF